MTKEFSNVNRENPLAGKTILITRTRHQADEFGEMVQSAGGTPVFLPTIEIVPPPSWNECDRALQSLEQYDGLIFTSANGVEFFFARLAELHLVGKSGLSKPAYAVGPRTRTALEQRGLAVTQIPEDYTAEGLSRVMSHDRVRNKKFLFPRGNLSRDELVDHLRSHGATVDSATVYTTQMPRSEDNHKTANLLRAGEVDVITFTSPSTVRNFVEMFTADAVARFHKKTRFAVIGPTTHSALRDLGFEADIVAGKSTMNDLLESIIHDLTSRA